MVTICGAAPETCKCNSSGERKEHGPTEKKNYDWDRRLLCEYGRYGKRGGGSVGIRRPKHRRRKGSRYFDVLLKKPSFSF